MQSELPVLYSFRRCPYAIRARMAIAQAGIVVQHREVLLRNKPQQMLEISAKGTVPVLQFPGGGVIDESLEIMLWALGRLDKDNWLDRYETGVGASLIAWNDSDFKHYLDRYKYAERYPDYPHHYYREQAEVFLAELESRLTVSRFLCGDRVVLADVAVFPFIRQFAAVDRPWFEESAYQALNNWLQYWLDSSLFKSVMIKHAPWETN